MNEYETMSEYERNIIKVYEVQQLLWKCTKPWVSMKEI